MSLAACGATEDTAGTGRAQVFVAAEDSIPEGLQAGTGGENIVDGWSVTYKKFLIGIGNFRASRSSGGATELLEPGYWVVDMMALPEGGLVLADFGSASAVRYDRFGFDLRKPSATALAAEGTSDADYTFMRDNGYSLYFEAELTKADGTSCTPGKPTECTAAPKVTVAWGVDASTSFSDCAPPEGDAGFAVPSGGTVQVKPTVHGDHWFFSNITSGAELTSRRAQWIVDCDTNHDGSVTLAELKAVKAADVFPSPDYNLSGALTDSGKGIETAYDYLLVQARTLGDFQGEGECPTREILK